MKYKGFCSACDVEYTLHGDRDKERFPATYCPGCGHQMPDMTWKEIGAGVELGPKKAEAWPDYLPKPDETTPDISEVVVAFGAKIYDVLSPEERFIFWKIISAYAKGQR